MAVVRSDSRFLHWELINDILGLNVDVNVYCFFGNVKKYGIMSDFPIFLMVFFKRPGRREFVTIQLHLMLRPTNNSGDLEPEPATEPPIEPIIGHVRPIAHGSDTIEQVSCMAG